jgi:hypothetical protein
MPFTISLKFPRTRQLVSVQVAKVQAVSLPSDELAVLDLVPGPDSTTPHADRVQRDITLTPGPDFLANNPTPEAQRGAVAYLFAGLFESATSNFCLWEIAGL